MLTLVPFYVFRNIRKYANKTIRKIGEIGIIRGIPRIRKIREMRMISKIRNLFIYLLRTFASATHN